MVLYDFIKKVFRLFNCEVAFYPSDPILRRKMRLLNRYRITTIIDVGANSGQYALEMRKLGFKGNIVSFEPIHDVFHALYANAKKDNNWSVYNYGLGNFDEKAEINIANNSHSSSLLEMLPAHLNAAPHSKYIGKEQITVKKLDSIFPEFKKQDEIYFLKIDTQGFEKQVLEGSKDSYADIEGIQLEMSMVPLYRGDSSFEQICALLKSQGYQLCAIEAEFEDPSSGKLLQVNGTFYKTDRLY